MGRVDELGVDLVADHDEVVTGGDLGELSSARPRVNTCPVGLCGWHSSSSRAGSVAERGRRGHRGRTATGPPPSSAGTVDDAPAGCGDRREERVVRRHVQHDRRRRAA